MTYDTDQYGNEYASIAVWLRMKDGMEITRLMLYLWPSAS